LRLRVLGAGDARSHWGEAPLPAGVELIDGWVDPTPHYADCVLALNPQSEIEGSALKLAEALVHGRAVVTTRDGARGYQTVDDPALIRVDDLCGMADAILSLLGDPQRLRRISAQAPEAVAGWSWSLRGAALTGLLERLAARR
jgi:glycosyltransferase involved in cell wall biosynthesis